VQYTDEDGNIIVPKSVRPVMDLQETHLGDRKGAIKQYRFGNLHIREYADYYTVHTDRVDPRANPLGHLLVDAPEYLAAGIAAAFAGRKVGSMVYNAKRAEGKDEMAALLDAVIAGYLAGSSAGKLTYTIASMAKKGRKAAQERQVDGQADGKHSTG
jgi:hypothetical protein